MLFTNRTQYFHTYIGWEEGIKFAAPAPVTFLLRNVQHDMAMDGN